MSVSGLWFLLPAAASTAIAGRAMAALVARRANGSLLFAGIDPRIAHAMQQVAVESSAVRPEDFRGVSGLAGRLPPR